MLHTVTCALIALAATPPSSQANGTATCRPSDAGPGFVSCTWTGLISPYDSGTPPNPGTPDSGPDAGVADARADASAGDTGARLDASALDSGPPPASSPGGIFDPAIPGSSAPVGAVFVRPPVPPLPAVGVAFFDPTFGTRVTRMLESGTHEYAQLAAFSPDSTRASALVLMTESGQGKGVYRYPSRTLVKRLPPEWYSPRWMPSGHRILYLLAQPVRIRVFDLDTNTDTEIANTGFQYAWTSNTFEEPSYDGRWTAVWVRNESGPAYLWAVDIANKRMAPWRLDHATLYDSGTCTLDPQYGKLGPDWVRPSPSGRYFMIQWGRSGTKRCQGLELWDIETGAFVKRLHDHNQHSDPALTPDGREFLATQGSSPLNNNYPALAFEWFASETTTPRVLPWRVADHISCLGNRGVCVSDAALEQLPNITSARPFAGEVVVWRLNGDAQRIAYHYTNASGHGDEIKDYFAQASCNIARSGELVICNTDWSTPDKTFPIVIEVGEVTQPAPGGPDAGVADSGVRADAGPGAPDAGPTTGGMRVLPLGDSLTVGYPSADGWRGEVKAAFGARLDLVGTQASGSTGLVDREHEGHSGWTIARVDAEAVPLLAAQRPDVVLVMAGTNDLYLGGTAAQAAPRMESLLGRIRMAVPSALVIVGAIPPQRTPQRTEVVPFNDAVKGIVARLALAGMRVRWANVSSGLTLEYSDILSDNVHPTEAGYSKLAAGWTLALTGVVP